MRKNFQERVKNKKNTKKHKLHKGDNMHVCIMPIPEAQNYILLFLNIIFTFLFHKIN